jgi:multidrug efflux pump subunit AcrB
MGFTINRVSLFALIFSIGILVDDAIVMIENIARHWAMPMTAAGSMRRSMPWPRSATRRLSRR